MKNRKVVLTGGHAATTAIAVAQVLIREGLGKDLFWIGPRYLTEDAQAQAWEFRTFSKLGVKTYHLISGRWQRKFSRFTLFSLFKIPVGFGHALLLLHRIRPHLVVSFGGFTALPLVFGAWLKGIPVIIHEQTRTVGLANRLSALLAKKILLARASSRSYFPVRKTLLIGNPVIAEIGRIKPKLQLGQLPVILITAGARGSKIINDAVEEALPDLTRRFRVIHLTGEVDYPRFAGIKKPNYKALSFVDPLEMARCYQEADLVVARSGANTVSEIILTKKPALLIPIPWAYLDEQTVNAQEAVAAGLARIIKQEDLNGSVLLREISLVMASWEEIRERSASHQSPDQEAAEKMAAVIKGFLA